MRKFFALALAVAMVLSLASVSFAATASSEAVIALSDFHKYDADTNELKEAQAQYGKTYYAMIFEGKYNFPATPAGTVYFTYNPITKYEQVEKLKVKAEFEMGEDLVDSISIVKKAFDKDSIMQPNPAYAAAVAADTNGSKWINATGSAFVDGKFYYIVDDAANAVVGTPTAGVALYGKDVTAADDDNGVIDMYDLYEVDTISATQAGTEADPYMVTLKKITAAHTAVGAGASTATKITDEIGAVQLEVKNKNDLVKGTATWNAGTKVWDETAGTELINAPATGKYYYFVEVKTKSDRVVGDADVIGTFEFNRKSKDDVAKIDDCEVDFNFNLWYEKNYIGDKTNLLVDGDSVELKWDDLYVLKFENDDEVEFEFGKDDLNEGLFTVDVSGQGKMVIDFNTKANDAICAANEGAKMFFVNFNGAKFNRTGVFEYEMENMVAAYQIVDDKLVEIAGLEMDGDTAIFSTRTLGNYVFANAELVNPAAAVVEAPVVAAPAVTNPSTGA